MRRALFAAVLGAIGAIAGCTFLVSFDDPLPPLDDADVPETSLPDGAPPHDARADFDPKKSAACKGLADGHYCGNNLLVGYPFDDDLVECEGGAIADTKICTRLCLHLLNPHPDQCDECATKPDGGGFCGNEFPGWVTTGTNSNANVYVHCQSGGQDRIDYCAPCTPAVNSKGMGAATCTK